MIIAPVKQCSMVAICTFAPFPIQAQVLTHVVVIVIYAMTSKEFIIFRIAAMLLCFVAMLCWFLLTM